MAQCILRATVLLVLAGAVVLVASVCGLRAFPKHRTHGHRTALGMLLTAPIAIPNYLAYAVHDAWTSEPAHTRLCDTIWMGRRPRRLSALPVGVDVVLDLTTELYPDNSIVSSGDVVVYICVPCPLGALADRQQWVPVLQCLLHNKCAVLIHCARGHTRSSAIAAVLMHLRGYAPSWQEAHANIRRQRPGVRVLSPSLQHQCHELCSLLSARWPS